jgi:hypothetical protein
MIPVTLLEFHLFALGGLDLGGNPGSSLRGALYAALQAMYDTGNHATRSDAESNPVAWLLRLEDEATTGGKDVPRPIAVRPSLVAAGENLSFGISFYGRGREHILLIISAVAAMQRQGIGRGRGHFKLVGVDSRDPLTGVVTPILDSSGKSIGEPPPPPEPEAYTDFAARLNSAQLDVTFLTPTRIVDRGKLCQSPVFRPWFQRLLERVRVIGELYTDAPPWIPFQELLEAARQVELVAANTRWLEIVSGSRRDGTLKPTSGFVGKASYQGSLEKLLPWVLLGQSIQVGKNTIKGCGWYRVEMNGD